MGKSPRLGQSEDGTCLDSHGEPEASGLNPALASFLKLTRLGLKEEGVADCYFRGGKEWEGWRTQLRKREGLEGRWPLQAPEVKRLAAPRGGSDSTADERRRSATTSFFCN